MQKQHTQKKTHTEHSTRHKSHTENPPKSKIMCFAKDTKIEDCYLGYEIHGAPINETKDNNI